MNNSSSLESLLKLASSVSPDAVEAEYRRREDLKNRHILDQSIEASKERCKTLIGFIREAWHVVEPTNPYVHGWHLDAICLHLEACARGDITRLLVNIPPGTAKSLLISVFFQAWLWGPNGQESLRFLSTSHNQIYVTRDTRRTRDLIVSEWYQARWGDRVFLNRTGEMSFANDRTGWREGVTFANLTSGRGNFVLVDDPHSTETAESPKERETALRIFRESLPSRVIDPEKSVIIIIMQRLHVDDVSGSALSLGLGYEWLMLPMEFEPDRRCVTSIGFRDPRKYEGELLFPERFPPEVIARDKKAMTSFAWAGQMQQRPTLREGGLFKRDWFRIIESRPIGTRWVRYWDLAATADQLGSTAAYTVGLLLGRQPNGRLVIGDVVRMRAEGQGVRKLIRDTAKADGFGVEIGLPIDPGQAGKVQSQDMVLMLSGYVVRAVRESGDKITRAEPVASQAEAGNIDMVKANWNDAFIEEATNFPGATIKDQVDALSGAYNRLVGKSVFHTAEDRVSMEPLRRIPANWGRVACLTMTESTVGVLWAAHDRLTDILYVYDVLVQPRYNMALHAEAIRSRGAWIPVLFDPEGDKRERAEGLRIAQHLADLMVPIDAVKLDAEVAVEATVTKLESGKLRAYETLSPWFAEYRRYGRNDKHELETKDVTLMQSTLMLVMYGADSSVTEARATADDQAEAESDRAYARGRANQATGY